MELQEESKSKKIYYTIGEVAEMFDVNQSLIRHWEKYFDILRPKRNKKGNRLFTPRDIENLKLIYYFVKEKGMRLESAARALKVGSENVRRDAEVMERLQHVRSLLSDVLQEINRMEKEGTNEIVVYAETEEEDNREENNI